MLSISHRGPRRSHEPTVGEKLLSMPEAGFGLSSYQQQSFIQTPLSPRCTFVSPRSLTELRSTSTHQAKRACFGRVIPALGPWRLHLSSSNTSWLRFQSVMAVSEVPMQTNHGRHLNVVNSITDWTPAGRVKVVGLGTRASSILQACHESNLLSSTELWIAGGDGMNLQSYELLFNNNIEVANVADCAISSIRSGHATRNVVFLVISIGASLSGTAAMDILQSCKAEGGLCVMIVIQPFNFEGMKRKKEMEMLTASLVEHVDLNFVFEHDALFRRERVTLAEALRLVNNTALYGMKILIDFCMGHQQSYCDAPPEGLREITTSEIVSIFGRAGNAWIGFGSSYSVKTAIQRAAFESPYLQGLIPGLKGLVACSIVSSESKGRKDIQAALHALRCIIGPRAHLMCTILKDPSLGQGVVLATILVTRIENFPNQSTKLQELSSQLNISFNSKIMQSSSMNGRELRKPRGGASDDEETLTDKPNTTAIMQEDKGSLGSELAFSHYSDCDALVNTIQNDIDIQALGRGGDEDRTYMLENADYSKTSEMEFSDMFEDNGKDSIVPQELHTIEISSCSLGKEERNTKTDREIVSNESVGTAQGLRQEESGLDFYQDHVNMYNKWNIPENDEDEKWKLPTLSSIVKWGKMSMGAQMKSLTRWESGPNSAVAEAWALARRRLGSISGSEKSSLPIGVRPNFGDTEPVSEKSSREQISKAGYRESMQFNLSAPLTRVLTSSLEAVAEIYNAASSKLPKNFEDEAKEDSSFLSARAASMLETERSGVKLTPLVEMRYKNGVYKGRCYGGLPEGKGRLTFKDGSFYDGIWKQGKRAGSGSFYYANGDVFQGYWRDDQMHGKGWFYYHTGDRLYADFWKGKANGEGRFYSAKGEIFFGQFRENWRHGKCLFIEASGVKWSEVWDYGVLLSRKQLEDTEEV